MRKDGLVWFEIAWRPSNLSEHIFPFYSPIFTKLIIVNSKRNMLQAGFEPGTYGILSTWIWESALDRSATTSKLKKPLSCSAFFIIYNCKR